MAFTLADLVDYEAQIALLDAPSAAPLPKLDAATLQSGKKASLKAWLSRVRGRFGEHFAQLRAFITLGLVLSGALLGWGTIRVLLRPDSQTPVNILYFLAFFVLMPLLFFAALGLKDLLLRFLGHVSNGWLSLALNRLLETGLRRRDRDDPALEAWRRIRTLHPQVFALQAWVLSQIFALSYYLAAAVSFLLLVSVNDYAFSWQSTLQIGPKAFGDLTQLIAWPFAWALPQLVPSLELIESTRFDRFLSRFVQPDGSLISGQWWPFLFTLILVYGCLPRLILALVFAQRLRSRLHRLTFTDFASENLWLRLQGAGASWEAGPGTELTALPSSPEALDLQSVEPILLIRWRQAPFQDEDLRRYFEARGYGIDRIMNAEGRESEVRSIVDALKKNQAVALVCEAWELPGEAFNQLRLAIRRVHSNRNLILVVPLEASSQGLVELRDRATLSLWQSGVRGLKDPYVGLLAERT